MLLQIILTSSLLINSYNSENQNLFSSIEIFEKAKALSDSISDLELRDTIYSELKSIIDYLNKYQDSDENVQEKLRLFYENIGEILADCPNPLKMKIHYFIDDAIRNISQTMNINCFDDETENQENKA